MTRLAKFNSSREEHADSTQQIFGSSHAHPHETLMEKGDFSRFLQLPAEIRLQIWRTALPNPRIVTPNAYHNRHLAILGSCQEARKVVESYYTRILSPTRVFPQNTTPVLHVNIHTDTVIRDLTIRDVEARSLFSLNNSDFITSCHQMLSGLSQVQHLALAYDVLRENGGTLFRSIQVCCPKLKTVTIFPNAQLLSSTRQSNQNLKFVDVDSNLLDYTSFRWEAITDRKTKVKALRGLAVIATLFSHSLQYKWVFRDYIETYGQNWRPVIKICLLARWNRQLRGWQTRSLVGLGDRCSRGFEGEDGRIYKGFVEAGMVCGEDGEILSRYDGMELLFGEDDI